MLMANWFDVRDESLVLIRPLHLTLNDVYLKAHLHTATATQLQIAVTSLLNRSQSDPPVTSNLVAVAITVANAVCNSTVHNLCN